ncbi:hypothetical protein CWO85_02500 [Candidatus Phytoplasma ziziphi]|uniref:Uncharacterized protein n=1 Tax=Ziziphus jujuba witches'-broom phytoplasma TaxID=135727 RepID=A0A660HNA8_ZIZJU|nr:hypothetical protein [Candidatus Phytoplasma ziziphi]AYJ01359.1 hypothetical protein CWO85_02500 [Candidatus Phytoplasma ziziphi]
MDNVVFKKLSDDQEQYNKEKDNLFNEGKINEIRVNISDINNNILKKENLLTMYTSDQYFIFFQKTNPEEEENENIKKQKEKSNFFLNDPRLRKALFLSLNRDLLGKNDYFGLIPSFSFVSDVTLFTDYDFFNQQDFHQQNLDNLIEIEPNKKLTMDNNTKFYQPEKAKELLNAVNQDFEQKFSQNDQPLIIKIFTGYNDSEIKEKKLTQFMINSWKNVFNKDNINFLEINDGEFNISIDFGPFQFIKNPNNIFTYILDEIKLPDGNSRDFILTKQKNRNHNNDIIIQIDPNYNNDIILIEQKLNINELKEILDKLQKKIDQPDNNQRSVDLLIYSNILKQLEQKTFEELLYLPLVKGTKYKIYRNLENDFVNSFLLWRLNDDC